MSRKTRAQGCENRKGETHLHDRAADALLRFAVFRYARAHVVVQRDERERQLAAVLVGRSNDAHVRDVRVLEQVALELRGRHLEPAHLDELLDPVDDEDLLALVEVHLVPRAHPPVLERLRRPVCVRAPVVSSASARRCEARERGTSLTLAGCSCTQAPCWGP